MSWLYTIVFAGLVFSSEGSSVSTSERIVQDVPVVVQTRSVDETEKFEKSYPLSANGRVSISNVNGSITVEAWDKNEVKLEYTKVADNRDRLADVEINIESRPDYFSVETDYTFSKSRNTGDRDYWKNGGKLNVEFRLMVPKSAILNEVETVNGSVTVSNFVNVTVVSAVNGSVNASNIRGTAKLSTVNGEVKADFDRIETGSKISLETVNGRVSLVLPSDSNATVKAESLNGSITNDFGLTVRKGKYVGRDLYGKLGGGDVRINLESVNGSLSIGRKNDGKSLSPSTDLLPQKDKDDDDDWSDPNMTSSKVAKIDKQVAKAVKESSKVSAEVSSKVAAAAMADARREIERIQPELAKINAEAMANVSETLAQTAELMKSEEMLDQMRRTRSSQLDALRNLNDAAFFPSIPRVEKKSDSFPVKGIPQVTVSAKGASVTVRGWDKSEVKYSVTQFSDSRNRQPVILREDHSDSAVSLMIDYPSSNTREDRYSVDARRVRIEIFVPRKSNLKIDAMGTIRLEGVSGDLQVTGGDENIDVRDSDGKLLVSNSDGLVRIVGFRGDLIAKTADGDVRMDGDFTSINGQAGDGKFILTVPADTDADITGSGKHGFSFAIEDMETGKQISQSNWKFGKGSRKYRFITNDGSLVVQSRSLLEAETK